MFFLRKHLTLGVVELLYWKWVLESHIGRSVSLSMSQKATVIIPSYSEKRVRNLRPLVRSLLKCDFVEKVIVSNNNPRIRIRDRIGIDDSRVVIFDQPVRRGPGYGWILASKEKADYVIAIDDDLLISPKQLAMLFQQLVEHPEAPHGLLGCDSDGTYVKRQEAEVASLYNIYAVTGAHIRTYLEHTRGMTARGYVTQETVEFWSCDMVISQSGMCQPRIHDAGFVLQCITHDRPGVALWKDSRFRQQRKEVYRALEKVRTGSHGTE